MEIDAHSTGSGSGRPAVAVLAVEGMHCSSCVALIEEMLVEDLGVTRAEVDLESGRARVTYDAAQHTVEDLCSAVAAAGYTATVVDPSADLRGR